MLLQMRCAPAARARRAGGSANARGLETYLNLSRPHHRPFAPRPPSGKPPAASGGSGREERRARLGGGAHERAPNPWLRCRSCAACRHGADLGVSLLNTPPAAAALGWDARSAILWAATSSRVQRLARWRQHVCVVCCACAVGVGVLHACVVAVVTSEVKGTGRAYAQLHTNRTLYGQ